MKVNGHSQKKPEKGRLRPLNFYCRALLISTGALTAAIYTKSTPALWISSVLLFTLIAIVTAFAWKKPSNL